MGNLFKDLTAGFSTFVLSWLIPSTVVSAIFALIVYPEVQASGVTANTWLEHLAQIVASGPVAAAAVFAVSVVSLAVISALSSRPLYRLLEGYTLPRSLRAWLLRKQLYRYRTFQRLARPNSVAGPQQRGLAREQLLNYPAGTADFMPTRLGNALKALETYAKERFVLDSQTFYYELYSAAPERCRQDADSARASVDFFISFVGLLAVLSGASAVAAIVAPSITCLAVAVLAALLAALAYRAALQNMTDWRYAMQAIVNTGRTGLAQSLGYRLPDTLGQERHFWDAWNRFVAFKADGIRGFDDHRLRGVVDAGTNEDSNPHLSGR